MDSGTARSAMDAYLKEQFGRIASLREIAVKRSSSGRIWVGRLYCVTSRGDVEIGHITVDESGNIVEAPGVDHLVDALSESKIALQGEGPLSDKPPEPGGGDFSDLMGEDDFSLDDGGDIENGDLSEVDKFFANLDHDDLRSQIVGLLSSGKSEDLEIARQLMPQLLTDPVGRGTVLRQMAELEQRLGNIGLAVEYFNAAAREFADRGDFDALKLVAELAARILGDEFENHTIRKMVDQTEAKLLPTERIEQIAAFAGLSDEELFEITGAAEFIRVEQGETILREGEPAVRAYVIKSGVLKVELETPDGANQLARCCFPGEFVGETSVLEQKGATCNATVSALEPVSLWCFEGDRLRALAREFPDLQARIEEARTLHRVDSFFAMNQATGLLDARVRDQLLGCICAIKRAEAGDVLGTDGVPPEAVYLISRGTIEYRRNTGQVLTFEQDAFVNLGDTLHELLLEGDLVAVTPCRLLVFDTRRLKALAAAAPPDVVAVLERLG